MVRILLLISLFVSSFVFSGEKFRCLKNGEIKKISNGKSIKEISKYCVNHVSYEIISLDCLQDNNCEAMTKYKKEGRIIPLKIGSTGNPFHNKCFILNGKPELVEYFDGKKWIETGLCYFEDKSFITVFNSL